MVTLEDIRDAAARIGSFVHKTPLMYSRSLSEMTGTEVYLKAENLQKTGSFKVRGAFNRLIQSECGRIIAASMGNHAQGLAYAAGRLGIQAKIVMPVTASLAKEEATKGYGAEVVLHGESFRGALDYALSQKDYLFIHAFDDEGVIAGQGTIGLEIMEELQGIDVVLVPVGGGGLISGIAMAVRGVSPATEVIGVQSESVPAASASFSKKEITEIPPSSTIADGIAVGRVGEKTFAIIEHYVDDMIVVSEDSIAMAILFFLERKKLVVEGAGAVPLAALLENRERFRGRRIVLVVSGGNIDFTLIDRIIHKGLIASGRIRVFEVIVDDIPGTLHALTGVIASHRGNILDVAHERFTAKLPVGRTSLIFTIETRGKTHGEEILSDLVGRGFPVKQKL
ncbi:MAG TPA: threonine ammonia-lyase [Thermodesulfovibrionales bacterium]|nr:threonine ammonia-lyase [Thermodesulfovibrionales bacterium]